MKMGKGKTLKMVVLAVLAVAALLQITEAQTTHVVGDALGWNVPPGGASAYSTWASSKTFSVGDVLVFNFTTGAHDVAEVSKAAFDACNKNSPISSSNTGPTNIPLSTAAEHYYICTIGSHCTAGQKLAINVSAGTGTPPPSTPSGSTAPPPPPPSSTPSFAAAAALPVTLLSIVVALLH